MDIFGILIVFQIEKFFKFVNFWNWVISEIWLFYEFFNNGKFDEFRSCKIWDISGIVKFFKFWNFSNWKLTNIQNFFEFRKSKFGSQHWQILEFVYSIFCITRNFANSHTCAWYKSISTHELLNFDFLFQWLSLVQPFYI